jgi:PTH1 family peptidyl-tRNA hydrolase
MDHLGGGFTRVRLGIGKPPFKDDTEHYVLQSFPKADLEALAGVVRTACEAVREILGTGVRPAMNRFNRRDRTPSSEPENTSE